MKKIQQYYQRKNVQKRNEHSKTKKIVRWLNKWGVTLSSESSTVIYIIQH